MNPVLNLQSINPYKFSQLRDYVEKNIFNNFKLCSFLKKNFNNKPKIIQSMYFLRVIQQLMSIKIVII